MPVVKTEVLTLEKLRRLAAGDEPAETHVMELLESMRSQDEEVRAWTSDALQTVEVLPKELARNVADMCLQPSAAVSAAACRLLVKLGDEATQYQAAIVACLTQHPEITARQQAALALSSVAGLTPETLAALREAAESPDPRLKRLASNALNQAEA